MLLDVREVEKHQHPQILSGVFGLLGLLVISGMLIKAIVSSGIDNTLQPQLEGTTKALGIKLFTDYVLLFEIMGVLLLVGTMGVVLLSKKKLR